MTDKKKHISTESLGLWYQSQLNRYNTVAGSNNAIDNKSGVLLAANIAVLAIGVSDVSQNLSLLGVFGALGLLISTTIAVINIHVRDAKDEAVTSEDRIDYYYLSNHKFAWQLLADIEGATKHNKRINKRKAKLYYWVVYTFLVSSLILLLSNFITITLIFK